MVVGFKVASVLGTFPSGKVYFDNSGAYLELIGEKATGLQLRCMFIRVVVKLARRSFAADGQTLVLVIREFRFPEFQGPLPCNVLKDSAS